MSPSLTSVLTIAGISLLASVVVVLVGIVIAILSRRFPNRSRRHPDRIRMPRIVLIVGLVSIAVGLWFGLAAGEARYPSGMRIASVVLIVAGLVMLLAYLAWYVEPGTEAISTRTWLGRTRSIAYAEIVSYRFTEINGQRHVSVASTRGETLTISTLKYDVSPLLAAIDFREARGRWPLRGELPMSSL